MSQRRKQEKLEIRDFDQFNKLKKARGIRVHPLFKKVKGDIEDWEVINHEP